MVIDTHADKLYHRYYLVTVPACDYYDPRFVQKFGLHTHADPKVAKAMLTDRIHEQMCPAMMASWVAEDIDVRMVDPTDSVIVFKNIMGHIADWRDHLACMPLIADCPIVGLHEFHNLAKHMYRVARDNGLGRNNRTRIKARNQHMLMRNVQRNQNDNPFNFKFNGTIWEDLLMYLEMSGTSVKRYRDTDFINPDAGRSGQDKLGSTNVNFATRYNRPKKHRSDERDAS